MSERRALIAGALTVVYPGVGHLYLRRWFRAAAWFGLALATALLLVPESVVETARSGGLVPAARSLPTDAVAALLFVRVITGVDAVLIGLGTTHGGRTEGEQSCPECGRELDDDLEFCPWCAASVESW